MLIQGEGSGRIIARAERSVRNSERCHNITKNIVVLDLVCSVAA